MPVSSSASASTQTPMSYDRFRPKFPLDPFSGVDQTDDSSPSARAPWTLDADALPPKSILQHERRVILIIGQATGVALAPLFASQHLASSLVIIASHRPPALPFDTHPSVYTLRLRTPLAVADAGATRLVEVLEWALQVAQLWRRSGGPKKQELMEEITPGSQSVPLGQSFGRIRYSVAPDSQQDQTPLSAFNPAASMTSLTPSTAKKSRRHSLFRRQSSLPLVSDPASAKPFDALLHFLPADASDRGRLKAAILVTTLTRPYLAVPPTRAPSTRFYSEPSTKLSLKSGKRWSFFRGGSSTVLPPGSSSTLSVPSQSISTTDLSEVSQSRRSSLSTLALLRARRSRLIHLMPSGPAPIRASASSSRHPATNASSMQAQAHLVRSMEAFLLSFCFSMAPDLPPPIAGFPTSDVENAKARPYVLPATALPEVLQFQSDEDDADDDDERNESKKKRRNEWTLAELVLSGALESEAETRSTTSLRSSNGTPRESDEGDKGKEKLLESASITEWMEHRAWLGGVRDIVIVRSMTLKGIENAHIATSRSNSQPLLPSQSNSRSFSAPPSSSSRSQTQSRSQPLIHPQSAQYQTYQPQDQTRTMRSIDTYRNPSSTPSRKSTLYVDTKRKRDSKKSGYQSLAIEKRLPTPPEDENENLEDQDEDEGDSIVSNATSCSRSPHPDEDEKGGKRGAPRVTEAERAVYEPAYSPVRRRSDRVNSRDSSRHGRHQPQSYACPYEQQHPRSYSRTAPAPTSSGSSSPSSSTPTSSRTHTPVPSTVRSSASRRHSDRHQSKPARSSSRRHEVYKAEDEYETDKQYVTTGSLPTPPDSEEASLEGVPDAVSPAVSPPSRERERTVVGRTSPSYSGRSRVQDERKRGRTENSDLVDKHREERERERERERRRRTYSQPPQPVPSPVSEERAPPRRAKTKPKERSFKDALHQPISRLERRASSGYSKKSDKPARPEVERNSNSGEQRHAKLETRPEMRRINTSPEERDRRAKRVPVPALQDVLPPLPRPRPPPPQRRLPSQPERSVPRDQSQRDAPGTSLTAYERERTSSSAKNHMKWKFWKTGTGSIVNT